jgi:hypothetical protein
MMSDAEFDAAVAEIDAALASGRVQMRFWICPVIHPWDRFPTAPTVEWDGDVACCLWSGCCRRSDDEVPRGICYCEEYVCHGECCGPGQCSCSDPRPDEDLA